MNNKQVVSNVDTAMMTTGVLVGLAQIQQIIGIVLVSVQLTWILGKCIYNTYKHYKEKKTQSIEHDVKTLVEELGSLKEQINGVKNG